MVPYAGYAAAIGIAQHVLQDELRSSYFTGALKPQIRSHSGMPGVLEFSIDFFGDVPGIVLSQQYRRSFLVHIRAWGPMTVSRRTLQGGSEGMVPEARDVLFDAHLEAPFDMSIGRTGLNLGIASNQIRLQYYSFTPFAGGDFSPDVARLLSDTMFKTWLEQSLRDSFDWADGIPPIDVAFLGPLLGHLITDPNVELSVTPQAFDGSVVIGINAVCGDAWRTTGTPAGLKDIVRGLGMALWMNPVLWADRTKDQLLPQISAQVEQQGAVLDGLEFVVCEGYLHVAGSAYAQLQGQELGSAVFSFRVYPRLIRPAHDVDLGPDENGEPCILHVPEAEVLWFETCDVAVDIDKSWVVIFYEVLLGAVSGGIIALIVESIVTMIRGKIVGAIEASKVIGSQDRVIRYQWVSNGPVVTAKIEALEFHATGIYMALSMATAFKKPAISRSGSLDAEEALRGGEIAYSVGLSHTARTDDPYLRIHWTFRREDNNTILVSSDAPAATNEKAALRNLANILAIQASCRVYRTVDSTAPDIFSTQWRITFSDRLDRSHPYVRWSHYVVVPDVKIEPDGSHTLHGLHIKYRESQIHRTDLPARCRMVSQYSLHVPRGVTPPPQLPARLQYLDTLPFPSDVIREHRDLVCEYCFFGGPANTAPLPLPAP